MYRTPEPVSLQLCHPPNNITNLELRQDIPFVFPKSAFQEKLHHYHTTITTRAEIAIIHSNETSTIDTLRGVYLPVWLNSTTAYEEPRFQRHN